MLFSTNSNLFYTYLQYKSEKSHELFGLGWKNQEHTVGREMSHDQKIVLMVKFGIHLNKTTSHLSNSWPDRLLIYSLINTRAFPVTELRFGGLELDTQSEFHTL